jgi:hypothetical protein
MKGQSSKLKCESSKLKGQLQKHNMEGQSWKLKVQTENAKT